MERGERRTAYTTAPPAARARDSSYGRDARDSSYPPLREAAAVPTSARTSYSHDRCSVSCFTSTKVQIVTHLLLQARQQYRRAPRSPKYSGR